MVIKSVTFKDNSYCSLAAICNTIEESIELTVITTDTAVTQIGTDLIATSDAGVSYSWLDCDNNYVELNETNQTYAATTSGNYAVKITNSTCVDTSACLPVLITGINLAPENSINISAYPNPTSDVLYLSSDQNFNATTVSIYDYSGKLINTQTLNLSSTQSIDTKELAKGIYLLKASNKKGAATLKFTVN